MTITRLFQTGFEWGNLTLETPIVYGKAAIAVPTIFASPNQTKTGNYALEVTNKGTGGNADGNKYITVPLGLFTEQARTSFHFRHISVPQTGFIPTFFEFASNATSVIRLVYSFPSIILHLAGSTNAFGVSDALNSNDIWSHVSIDAKIHATNGWVKVYVDGEVIIDYSGKTNHGANSINVARYGMFTSHSWSGSWGGGDSDSIYYDDIYIDDTTGELAPTFAEDRRFRLVTANGNGSYNQWLGNDGESINNYLHVDEHPTDRDNTYLSAVLSNRTDGFRMRSFTLPLGWQIASIVPTVLAKRDNSDGQLELQVGTRLGVTDQLSPQRVLKTDYEAITDYQPIKPGSGSWTQADLDVLEILIRTQES